MAALRALPADETLCEVAAASAPPADETLCEARCAARAALAFILAIEYMAERPVVYIVRPSPGQTWRQSRTPHSRP